MLKPADRVLVAVSGGPDSVCLLHVLLELGYGVGVAHLDHQTRSASISLTWTSQHQKWLLTAEGAKNAESNDHLLRKLYALRGNRSCSVCKVLTRTVLME